jgi:hypothetical protein
MKRALWASILSVVVGGLAGCGTDACRCDSDVDNLHLRCGEELCLAAGRGIVCAGPGQLADAPSACGVPSTGSPDMGGTTSCVAESDDALCAASVIG